jgi:hypothetical protein
MYRRISVAWPVEVLNHDPAGNAAILAMPIGRRRALLPGRFIFAFSSQLIARDYYSREIVSPSLPSKHSQSDRLKGCIAPHV